MSSVAYREQNKVHLLVQHPWHKYFAREIIATRFLVDISSWKQFQNTCAQFQNSFLHLVLPFFLKAVHSSKTTKKHFRWEPQHLLSDRNGTLKVILVFTTSYKNAVTWIPQTRQTKTRGSLEVFFSVNFSAWTQSTIPPTREYCCNQQKVMTLCRTREHLVIRKSICDVDIHHLCFQLWIFTPLCAWTRWMDGWIAVLQRNNNLIFEVI